MERMMRIHQTLVDAQFPNAKSLGRFFEVSAKTIQPRNGSSNRPRITRITRIKQDTEKTSRPDQSPGG
jgi:hypothetical protein